MAPDLSAPLPCEPNSFELVAPVFAGTPGVQLAVAFGSRARSSARRGSDLDIGVLIDQPVDLTRLGVAAERATRLVVDLIHLNSAMPLLRFEIARDGVVLFERTPGVWSDFRRRAMVDWWDWAPLARRMHHAAAKRLRAATGTPASGR
jgi:predicted nucleotidyltransferase